MLRDPFGRVRQHLVNHGFATAVMNRHFWAATKARTVAEIIPVPTPTCERNWQEVATAKKHGSKGGGVVFGVDTGAKR